MLGLTEGLCAIPLANVKFTGDLFAAVILKLLQSLG